MTATDPTSTAQDSAADMSAHGTESGGRLIGPTDRCTSVLVVTTAGYIRTVTRYVQCRRHGAHMGLHFAAWGGSQAWRQAEWSNRDANAIHLRDVPTGRRVW